MFKLIALHGILQCFSYTSSSFKWQISIDEMQNHNDFALCSPIIATVGNSLQSFVQTWSICLFNVCFYEMWSCQFHHKSSEWKTKQLRDCQSAGERVKQSKFNLSRLNPADSVVFHSHACWGTIIASGDSKTTVSSTHTHANAHTLAHPPTHRDTVSIECFTVSNLTQTSSFKWNPICV